LTEEGHYTGGGVAFGYRAVDKEKISETNLSMPLKSMNLRQKLSV
jgi:hypothetical protein